ncbi:MAG TPA: maleylacetoacetate isomerase, partial [Alphaproteobacteria bacterium]|nr:maleylacetoacetate isomerase [Alphaproteobacteria bacterium]
MKHYGFFRSSASYRLRIGLNLKGLACDYVPVHLSKGGGEQFAPAFAALNPQHLVPVLDDDGHLLTQSLAILEYLDETHPEPPILPSDPVGRARVRALAQIVACDIHPIDNLRVLNYLRNELKAADDAVNGWYRHWVGLGLSAIEALLAGHPDTGRFCHGDSPTIADICLVPQVFNAQRFKCPLDGYPTIVRIHEACQKLDAFDRA